MGLELTSKRGTGINLRLLKCAFLLAICVFDVDLKLNYRRCRFFKHAKSLVGDLTFRNSTYYVADLSLIRINFCNL